MLLPWTHTWDNHTYAPHSAVVVTLKQGSITPSAERRPSNKRQFVADQANCFETARGSVNITQNTQFA